MTEHLTSQQIAAYQSRSLPPAELLRMWTHASSCSLCGAQLRRPLELGLQTTLARAAFQASHTHLTYEQMEGYVDSRLSSSERAQVEEHMAACGPCSADLRGLLDVRDVAAQPKQTRAWFSYYGRNALWSWIFGWGAGLTLACLLAGFAYFRNHHAQPKLESVAQSLPREQRSPETGLHDGRRLLQVKDGSVRGLEGLPSIFQAPVLTALESGRLDLPVSAGSKPQPGGVLMGDASPLSKVRLLSPTDEVVQDQSPTLHWTPENGALYTVTVGDRDFNQVARSGWLREDTWHVPVVLQRGRTYSWQLTVRVHGKDIAVPAPPQAPAQFQVLSRQSETELQELRQQFGDSHLVMGTAYARYKLWNAARNEFTELARQNSQSPVANDLLKDLDRMQGPSRMSHPSAKGHEISLSTPRQ